MNRTLIPRLLPISVLLATLAVAQEQRVKPGINEKFLDPKLVTGE